MTGGEPVQRGREAFDRRAWREAFACLSEGAESEQLDGDDLERLAVAAYLVGRDGPHREAMERAHLWFLARGEVPAAVRCAFWLGMGWAHQGEVARAEGWFARAGRLTARNPTGPERGYLLLPVALQHLQLQPEESHRIFGEAAAIAEDSHDPDLIAMSRLGLGQSLVRLAEPHRGLVLLDEVMASVEAGEVSPVPTGIIYCAVIEVCQATFDLRRAREWTGALSDWCAAQPDLVPYRGQCLVHRAEILQWRGAWEEALQEAGRARERFRDASDPPAVGSAHYRMAELYRLRGDEEQAETHYRLASRWGHPPQPGLAQLRAVQGRPDVAARSLRRALAETQDPTVRIRLLAAASEIALMCGEVTAARGAADELAGLADRFDATMLRAVSAHVAGAVTLAEGEAHEALRCLRRASIAWRDLDAPYERARARALVSVACRRLGDAEEADMELDAARETFEWLGAAPELERLRGPGRREFRSPVAGLTGREIEVLELIASGRSNRAIAEELVISRHTVARHVQNIFAKLGVESRTAAAAFAYEHGLV